MLTLEGLDLVFDDTHKFYEAPFQVKANGGILLIDDFGSNRSVHEIYLTVGLSLLKIGLDYLTLHTGRKVEIPFDVLVGFFPLTCRREIWWMKLSCVVLRHKIEIGDPSYEEYREIFKRRIPAERCTIQSDQALALSTPGIFISNATENYALPTRGICAIRFLILPDIWLLNPP